MFTPGHFRVNEAWIALRVNDKFLFVNEDPYNIYVLMDAASAYVFGHVLSRAPDEAPDAKEVEALFEQARRTKNQWAKTLILTKKAAAENVFRTQAKKNGLLVKIIPVSELEPIVGPLKEAFATNFPGNTS